MQGFWLAQQQKAESGLPRKEEIVRLFQIKGVVNLFLALWFLVACLMKSGISLSSINVVERRLSGMW